ncbi:calcium/sodium antiporter [Sinimarinibacterium thermocellulolyticum]|uniref:Calcium/sodium antiporter n=1 Tax=Sinimarinibacterium thermocellulolyticum TaxID=3170016 RepID=A0ABV2AD43_9GAMM
MLLSFAAVVAGLVLLVWSADRFIHGAAGLARAVGISPLVVGMVIVGFGTSMPEVAVSTLAALQGSNGIAIGNVVGSNICNVALILGVSALVRPIAMTSGVLRKEIPITTAVSVLLVMLVLDGALTRLDGAVLAAGFVAMLIWMLRTARTQADDPLLVEQQAELPPALTTGRALMWIAIGLPLLIIASQLLVWGAVNIARELGVSDLVIGLTIVAVGTSLPELAASITGLLKNESDLAIGNILGSNLFNILFILMAPAFIAPGPIPDAMLLTRDLPVMVGLMLMLWAMAASPLGGRLLIRRVEGGLLLTVYVAYSLILALTASH